MPPSLEGLLRGIAAGVPMTRPRMTTGAAQVGPGIGVPCCALRVGANHENWSKASHHGASDRLRYETPFDVEGREQLGMQHAVAQPGRRGLQTSMHNRLKRCRSSCQPAFRA